MEVVESFKVEVTFCTFDEGVMAADETLGFLVVPYWEGKESVCHCCRAVKGKVFGL